MSKPDLLITVTDVKITLHTAAGIIGELANTTKHIAADLPAILAAHKPRSALMLLETSDLLTQTETLPRASWYDQRKLVARRLDLMFPGVELRTALALPTTDKTKRDYFFIAVPHAPQLTAIYNALAKAHTLLQGVCLFAAEVWGLHQRDDKPGRRNRITLLNMETHVRLLAEEPNALSLTRLLPPATATNALLCEQELQATQSYLLRRGWTVIDPYTLRTYRVPAATDFTIKHDVPHEIIDDNAQPFAALVKFLLAGNKPFCLLKPQRLGQRQQPIRATNLIDAALRIAAITALVITGVDAAALTLLQKRTATMQTETASLPKPHDEYSKVESAARYFAAIQDPFALITSLAAALPSYASLTELHYENGALNVTIANLPAAEQPAFVTNLMQRTGTTVTPANSGESSNGQQGDAAPETPALMLKIGGG